MTKLAWIWVEDLFSKMPIQQRLIKGTKAKIQADDFLQKRLFGKDLIKTPKNTTERRFFVDILCLNYYDHEKLITFTFFLPSLNIPSYLIWIS